MNAVRLHPYFFSFILFSISVGAIAQDEGGNAIHRFSVYSNFSTDFDPEVFDSGQFSEEPLSFIKSDFELGYISLAYTRIIGDGKAQGIELSRLKISRELKSAPVVVDSLGIRTRTIRDADVRLAFRYIYSVEVVSGFGKNDDWRLSLGAALRPYLHQFSLSPSATQVLNTVRTEFGIGCQLIPHLERSLKGPFHLEIDIPINLVQVEWDSDSEANPRIPIRHRRSTAFNSSLFPKKFALRAGIGYSF